MSINEGYGNYADGPNMLDSLDSDYTRNATEWEVTKRTIGGKSANTPSTKSGTRRTNSLKFGRPVASTHSNILKRALSAILPWNTPIFHT